MNNFDDLNPDQTSSNPIEEESFAMQHSKVKEQAVFALKSCNETQRALQSLREALLNCGICPHFYQCELQEDFNLQIDMVIADINEEWGW